MVPLLVRTGRAVVSGSGNWTAYIPIVPGAAYRFCYAGCVRMRFIKFPRATVSGSVSIRTIRFMVLYINFDNRDYSFEVLYWWKYEYMIILFSFCRFYFFYLSFFCALVIESFVRKRNLALGQPVCGILCRR